MEDIPIVVLAGLLFWTCCLLALALLVIFRIFVTQNELKSEIKELNEKLLNTKNQLKMTQKCLFESSPSQVPKAPLHSTTETTARRLSYSGQSSLYAEEEEEEEGRANKKSVITYPKVRPLIKNTKPLSRGSRKNSKITLGFNNDKLHYSDNETDTKANNVDHKRLSLDTKLKFNQIRESSSEEDYNLRCNDNNDNDNSNNNYDILKSKVEITRKEKCNPEIARLVQNVSQSLPDFLNDNMNTKTFISDDNNNNKGHHSDDDDDISFFKPLENEVSDESLDLIPRTTTTTSTMTESIPIMSTKKVLVPESHSFSIRKRLPSTILERTTRTTNSLTSVESYHNSITKPGVNDATDDNESNCEPISPSSFAIPKLSEKSKSRKLLSAPGWLSNEYKNENFLPVS